MYLFGDPLYSVSASNNTITLDCDTTGMSATDIIRIDYDDGEDMRALAAGYDSLTVYTDAIDGLPDPKRNYPIMGRDSSGNVQTLSLDATGGLNRLLVATGPLNLQVNIAGIGGVGVVTSSDGMANQNIQPIAAYNAFYNGSTWTRQRIATILKSNVANAAGDTAVWTPASGKRVRLIRYQIEIPNSATMATAGELTVKIRDASTEISRQHTIYIPSTPGSTLGAWRSGWIRCGNGYLSSTANNVLNVNLSSALTSGKITINMEGIEE